MPHIYPLPGGGLPLPMRGPRLFRNYGPNCPRFGEELERICDMLATEILMPKDIFLQRAGRELSIQKY